MDRNNYSFPADEFSGANEVPFGTVRSALRTSSADNTENSEQKRVRWQSPKIHRYNDGRNRRSSAHNYPEQEKDYKSKRTSSIPTRSSEQQSPARPTRSSEQQSPARPLQVRQEKIGEEKEKQSSATAEDGVFSKYFSIFDAVQSGTFCNPNPKPNSIPGTNAAWPLQMDGDPNPEQNENQRHNPGKYSQNFKEGDLFAHPNFNRNISDSLVGGSTIYQDSNARFHRKASSNKYRSLATGENDGNTIMNDLQELEELRDEFSPIRGGGRASSGRVRSGSNQSPPVRREEVPPKSDKEVKNVKTVRNEREKLPLSPKALNNQNLDADALRARMMCMFPERSKEADFQKTENITTKMESMKKKDKQVEEKDFPKSQSPPPFRSITMHHSHEISTVSEDSYQGMMRARFLELHQKQNLHNAEQMEYPDFVKGEIRKSCLPTPGFNAAVDENNIRSCMPVRLHKLTQKMKNKEDSVLTEETEKTPESKIDQIDILGEGVYEYGSGVNTYVAYFDHSRDPRNAFKVIEHPNPPLLPFDSNEVLVRIEASTVSVADCFIRRGDWWNGSLSLPRIPGATFSGKVEQISKKGKLQPGDQVLSLVTSGGNSRYVCIPKDRVVKIPKMDSVLATCLPEVYLSAFQAIHNGQNSVQRYRKNALHGKKILVLGGVTPVGRAVIELGREAGATVYATSREKQFSWITEAGGLPLSRELNNWMHTIALQIDVLIGINDVNSLHEDLTYDHLNILKRKGQLVVIGSPQESGKYPSIGPGKGVCHSDIFKILRRSLTFNVFEQWEKDMKQGKRDLLHIAGLMSEGKLNPKILDRIPLSRIGKAHALLEIRRLHGIIICEPWIRDN